MIKRKQIEAMRHGVRGTLISWQYVTVIGAEGEPHVAVFMFTNEDINTGMVSVALTIAGEPVMLYGSGFRHYYQMPRAGMPLEMVTAVGLKRVQALLMEDIQQRSLLVSDISIITEGM